MSLAGPGCFDAETMQVRSVSLGPLLIVVGVDEPEDRAVLSASSLRKASNSRSNLKDLLRDELLAKSKEILTFARRLRCKTLRRSKH